MQDTDKPAFFGAPWLVSSVSIGTTGGVGSGAGVCDAARRVSLLVRPEMGACVACDSSLLASSGFDDSGATSVPGNWDASSGRVDGTKFGSNWGSGKLYAR